MYERPTDDRATRTVRTAGVRSVSPRVDHLDSDGGSRALRGTLRRAATVVMDQRLLQDDSNATPISVGVYSGHRSRPSESGGSVHKQCIGDAVPARPDGHDRGGHGSGRPGVEQVDAVNSRWI